MSDRIVSANIPGTLMRMLWIMRVGLPEFLCFMRSNMIRMVQSAALTLLFLLSFPTLSKSQTPPAVTGSQPAAAPTPSPGHSLHGEAFNEGPRTAAHLIPGTGKVSFPVTSKNRQVQRFFDQGVGQLHGFWYFEAERSFRHVAMLDPNCAMAYWGMAMANVNNDKRAKEFMSKAVALRDKVSPREQMWIDCLSVMYEKREGDAAQKKNRQKDCIKTLSAIVKAYPKDNEAKAFLACLMWENQWTVPIFSKPWLDSTMKQVLADNPMHPLHHYRIHLWDGPNAKLALDSAAKCGQSSPGIAHMWHMPGHIYSDLQRYQDACYQQEAGVRVDNAQIRDNRILPDQIHNYAHNSEWLIRDLSNVGRAKDAVALACNMIEMPRHPKWNTIEKGSSTSGYGRLRLMEILVRFELWDEIIRLSSTPQLEPTENRVEQVKRLACLAKARAMLGLRAETDQTISELAAFGEKDKPYNLDGALSESKVYRAVSFESRKTAETLITQCTSLPAEEKALLYIRIGQADLAVTLAQNSVNSRKNEMHPAAILTEAYAAAGKRTEAESAYGKLTELMTTSDSDLPILTRIRSGLLSSGSSTNTLTGMRFASDTGKRPRIDSLGPFLWTPMIAPPLRLSDADGKSHDISAMRKKGKAVLIVFYLGTGCTKCMEQLRTIAPKTEAFSKEGIEVVAVSTDTQKGLKQTFIGDKPEDLFPFLILSDSNHGGFKAWHAYDDFEKFPLHGMFLVDDRGYVRWQDIGFEPFKDMDFAIKEFKRLLSIPIVESKYVTSSVKFWDPNAAITSSP